MAKNIVFPGVIKRYLPVPSGVVSGEVVAVGGLVGIAETDRDAAGNTTVHIGPQAVVQAAAATYAVGDVIYAHATGGGAVSTNRVGLIDKTSTTGTAIGYATEAKTLASTGSLNVQFTLV